MRQAGYNQYGILKGLAGSHMIAPIVSIATVTSKLSFLRSGRLYVNITETIAKVCDDRGDHDHLVRPCSTLLASLSFLRCKTAITEKTGGHEFCSFIEGWHCIGSRTKIIVFRRSSLIPGDMRTPDRFQSLRSPTIVSVFANDRRRLMR